MQLVSCYVNLAGDLRHVVWKDSVSVAEVLVLRGLHGADAVKDIRPVGGASRHAIGNVAEKERLIEIYGQKHDGPGRKLIEQLFPGFNPHMPATCKDIGVREFDDDTPAAAGAPAAMSPAGAGGSPQPWQVPDAQLAATTSQSAALSAGDEPGGDPPVSDEDLPAVEEDDPGPPIRSGRAIPGLTVT